MREIRVGVIGIGFMGRTHVRGYQHAASLGRACRLVAVADRDESRRRGDPGSGGNIGDASSARLFDPSEVRGYAGAEELLADPEVDLVSICTHTDTHVDLGIRALEAGKHVVVEKPVAVRSVDAQRLAEAASRHDRVCMPAMCIRFWPAWAWVKERVEDGTLGPVRSAVFHRLGTAPAWAPDFYRDEARTGGALVDLHIHDTDFVCYCFGAPDRVTSMGTTGHVTTLYHYDAGPPHVVAEGAWDHTPGFGYRMRYVVIFEGATVDFDLARDPQVRLSRDGEATPVTLPGSDGYQEEILHALDLIEGRAEPRATVEDAVTVARVLEAERRSLQTRAAQVP